MEDHDDIAVSQDFVRFYSPGTFVPEESVREIDSWNVEEAVELSRSIKERHGAVPYGFRFETFGRREGDLNSDRIASSAMYFLGGTILTLEEVEARQDPKNRILIANMKHNGIDRVIENRNSWMITLPFWEGSILIDYKPASAEKAEGR